MSEKITKAQYMSDVFKIYTEATDFVDFMINLKLYMEEMVDVIEEEGDILTYAIIEPKEMWTITQEKELLTERLNYAISLEDYESAKEIKVKLNNFK